MALSTRLVTPSCFHNATHSLLRTKFAGKAFTADSQPSAPLSLGSGGPRARGEPDLAVAFACRSLHRGRCTQACRNLAFEKSNINSVERMIASPTLSASQQLQQWLIHSEVARRPET